MAAWGDRLVSLGIAVILALLITYGVGSLLFSYPSFWDICPSGDEFTTEEACTAAGGEWYPAEGVAPPSCDIWDCPVYQDALGSYQINIAAVSLILVLVLMLISVFARVPSAVSDGLFGGGVLTLAMVSITMLAMNVALSIGLAVAALAALIFVAYRRAKKPRQGR